MADKKPMLRDGEEEASIRQAAWQLEDAMGLKVCDKYPPEQSARDLYFQVLRAQKWYSHGVLFIVALTIFETPTWCDVSKTWEFGDPSERCLVYGEPTKAYPDGKPIEVMLSGITYLPPGYSLILEVIILALLLRKLRLEQQLAQRFAAIKGGQSTEYYSMKKIYFCMIMILIEYVDVLVFATVRPKNRIAFLARAAIFCMLPSVIKLYRCITKILVEVQIVAVFFVGFLFFFAWVSVMIFNGDADPPENFATLGQAFYGLFVAGVCDEFTDILIESYTKYRWIGALWFIFLLVVHLLFLSLVLDTLCAGYMRSAEEEKEIQMEDKAQGILRSFRILAGEEGKLSREKFMNFLAEYLTSPSNEGSTRVNRQFAEIGFEFVDRDGDGLINEKEFAELLTLAHYSMWETAQDSGLKECAPNFWNHKSVAAVRDSVRDPDGTFEYFMTMVLGINFVLVIVETTYDLNKWNEPAWTEWLEFVFSFIYLGECLFKIGVSGWDYYQAQPSNIFDFGTTMLLLSTSIFESLLGGLSTYANILRLFRLLRVVKQLKGLDKVQFMVSTVVKLVAKAKDMLILLLVVLYGFTVVGVQLFGGLLYEESPYLEGSDYHEAKEFVLNFNDFLMAFGFWFVFLLCEFKPSFVGAISRTSAIPGSWIICIVFWMIAVCITFELVKAFTIEVYMDLKKKWDSNKSKVTNGDDDTLNPHDVLGYIEAHYELRNRKFWYKCLQVDEDEYDEVREALDEVLEEEEEGSEKGKEKETKKKKH